MASTEVPHVTPDWHDEEENVFRDHDRLEGLFGQLNCLFFVLGLVMNSLVAYAIKKKGIKSTVDVGILLISLSNWLIVFLDLFIGISYINNKKPMAFGSYWFSQFWGFLKVVNHEWFAAIIALLVLSNLMTRSKLCIFLMAITWLVIECILLTIPFAMGTRFHVFFFLPHPIAVSFPGFLSEAGYVVWFIITEVIPYLYFYLVTAGLLLANVMLYSNISQGHVEASPKRKEDTLAVIGYAIFYLITDSPELLEHLLYILQLTILHSCEEIYAVFRSLFFVSLFVNTMRAAAYPLVFFLTQHGCDVFVVPLRKITNLFQVQTNYRRFYGEETVRYGDIEEVDLEVEHPNDQV